MSMPREDDPPQVLDPRQLVRIQSVHKGFLYQHLYAAACLLQCGNNWVQRLVVEADEDIELHGQDRITYIQVKTRAATLSFGDIEETLLRFEQIRLAHESGARAGQASFAIVSNAPPNGPLAKRLANDWPVDVELLWPGGPVPGDPAILEPPSDVANAFTACRGRAAVLSFSMLVPETLVWKLAGQVMLAASGSPPRTAHSFAVAELPELFEQLVVQLQDFPAPPPIYRPQSDEPSLQSADRRLRIVAGYSGAGKTAWAGAAAAQTVGQIAYFDIGDTPGPALATGLARELAARLFSQPGGRLGELLLPGVSGHDLLQAIGRRLEADGENLTLVLDNGHRLPPSDLHALIQRIPQIDIVILCQPGAAMRELEVLAGIDAELLRGWDPDTIAVEADARQCRADFATCSRLAGITGALPFYIQNALGIARAEYGGDVAAFCAEIEAQTHIVETAQEIILARTFNAIDPSLQDALAALSIADVPLTSDEARALLAGALDLQGPAVARQLRALPSTGAMEVFGGGRIKVHDAMRLLALTHLSSAGDDRQTEVRRLLAAIIAASIQTDWSLAKLSLLIRLFGQTGQSEVLVEFATDELFHEMGVWPEIEPFLEFIADDAARPPAERCKALDGLVFNDLRSDNAAQAVDRLARMETLIAENDLDDEHWLGWAMKRMLALSKDGDGTAVRTAIDEMRPRVPDRADHSRVFRYNVAHAYFQLGDYALAEAETERLILEYYDLLGLSPEQVMGRNADALRPLLAKTSTQTDDLKHLADTLDLHAQVVIAQGNLAPFARIHALKFYDLARAPDSMIRVGQDLVDEFCMRQDFEGARELIETNLLPIIRNLKLAGRVVPVRSQYAVVLAYCGDFAGADAEMARLSPYLAGMDERGRGELLDQKQLIAQLKRFGSPPSRRATPPLPFSFEQRASAGVPKVGRNEPCPCGSGTKFKKCHGA